MRTQLCESWWYRGRLAFRPDFGTEGFFVAYPDIREGEAREDYEARMLTDLQKSIDVIEAELGATVTFLSYPYGAKDNWAGDFIADHFAVTLLTKSGVADLSNGLYSLPRKTVTMDHSAAACFQ